MTGTTLNEIIEIMDFDNELRLLVFNAVSILERWVRTDLIYNFSIHFNDAFAYTKYSSYPKQPQYMVDKFIKFIKGEMNHSKEVFVQHYKIRYYQENYLPAWMAAEIMSMGTMNRFYQLMDKNLKSQTVEVFNVHEVVFHSWLNSIRNVRNICAHHNRLWNRDLSFIPKIPKKSIDWSQYKVRNDKKLFLLLSIINYMLKQINCHPSFKSELDTLFIKYRNIRIIKMDFPQNWGKYNFWK